MRLHRLGASARKAAQMLKMGPALRGPTARRWRPRACSTVPRMRCPNSDCSAEAVQRELPSKGRPQHESSISKRTEAIETMLEESDIAALARPPRLEARRWACSWRSPNSRFSSSAWPRPADALLRLFRLRRHQEHPAQAPRPRAAALDGEYRARPAPRRRRDPSGHGPVVEPDPSARPAPPTRWGAHRG